MSFNNNAVPQEFANATSAIIFYTPKGKLKFFFVKYKRRALVVYLFAYCNILLSQFKYFNEENEHWNIYFNSKLR